MRIKVLERHGKFLELKIWHGRDYAFVSGFVDDGILSDILVINDGLNEAEVVHAAQEFAQYLYYGKIPA